MERLRKSFRKFSTRRRNRNLSSHKSSQKQAISHIETDSIQFQNTPAPAYLKTPENTPTVAPSLSRFIDETPLESSDKHPDWQMDERLVKQGKSNFRVKFLGYIEVKEARGMDVCEEAVKQLKYEKMRKKDEKAEPLRKFIRTVSFRGRRGFHESISSNRNNNNNNLINQPNSPALNNNNPDGIPTQLGESIARSATKTTLNVTKSGRKFLILNKKSVLWISPDSLRVLEDKTSTLLLDQTIEKVSFCAPDSQYAKMFSYICRDGTTRKWWCYSFEARKGVKGERLSHAVGCAFTACLKRKQDLEKHAKEAEKLSKIDENNETPKKLLSKNDDGDPNNNNQESAENHQITDPKKLTKSPNINRQISQIELEKAERTKTIVDEKHPELRNSMRRRPKGGRNVKLISLNQDNSTINRDQSFNEMSVDVTPVNLLESPRTPKLSPRNGQNLGKMASNQQSPISPLAQPKFQEMSVDQPIETKINNISAEGDNENCNCTIANVVPVTTSHSCDKSSFIDNDSIKGLNGSKQPLQSLSHESNNFLFPGTNAQGSGDGPPQRTVSHNQILDQQKFLQTPMNRVTNNLQSQVIKEQPSNASTLMQSPSNAMPNNNTNNTKPPSYPNSVATSVDPVLQPIKSIDSIMNRDLGPEILNIKPSQWNPWEPDSIRNNNSVNVTKNHHLPPNPSLNPTQIQSKENSIIKPEIPCLQPDINHSVNITNHSNVSQSSTQAPSIPQRRPVKRNDSHAKKNNNNNIELVTKPNNINNDENATDHGNTNNKKSPLLPDDLQLTNLPINNLTSTNPFMQDVILHQQRQVTEQAQIAQIQAMGLSNNLSSVVTLANRPQQFSFINGHNNNNNHHHSITMTGVTGQTTNIQPILTTAPFQKTFSQAGENWLETIANSAATGEKI